MRAASAVGIDTNISPLWRSTPDGLPRLTVSASAVKSNVLPMSRPDLTDSSGHHHEEAQ